MLRSWCQLSSVQMNSVPEADAGEGGVCNVLMLLTRLPACPDEPSQNGGERV